ncbi:MAG TPA: tetratricopeptide repeat protein [Rhizomicrobium sp.]|nr:tetratricopeptide repeat protein [Rhizomicrobium sp.]
MKALVASLLGALLLAPAAQAAITVLGPGPAQECYQIAENGGDLRDGIARCSFALSTALSITDRAATFVNRGVLRLGLHENELALADINSGLALDPNLSDAYVDRGAASMAIGHYEDALADLNKGISLGPHRPQIAYYDRAIVYEHNGDIRAAYDDYRKALEIEPGFSLAAAELKRFRVVHKQNGV